MEYIRTFLVSGTTNIDQNRVRREKNTEQFAQLKAEYPWCSSVKEIYLCFINDIKQPPVCKICPNHTKFYNGKYKIYCSHSCSNKDLAPERISKGHKTKLSRYGNSTYNNTSKAQETCLTKYGVNNPNLLSEVRKKISDTNLKKYGCNTFMNSEEGQKIIRENFLQKYGVEYYAQTDTQRKVLGDRNRTNSLNNPKNIYQIARIIEELKNSQTKNLKEISGSLKIDYRRFLWLVKQFNIQDPNPTNRRRNLLYDDSFKEKLKKDYNNITINELGKMYGIDDTTMWRILQEHKIPPNYEHFTSSQEREIRDYIKSLTDYEILTNTRQIISPLELDIFIPELSFAVEFNGNYWHTFTYDDYRQNTFKHSLKTNKCKAQNIFLLHIRESQWEQKPEIIKSMISNKLGKHNRTIYARKCEIKIVANTEVKDFLNRHHLQGAVNSSVNLGLYYQNELVSLMTFGKSRFIKNAWELMRFANKCFCKIPGGASKLLSYFEKNYNPNMLFTYADLEYSYGKLYETLGFQFKKQTPPSYQYFDGVNYHNRMKFQKKLLKIPEHRTEKEYVMNKLGLRIYPTCGNLVFFKDYTNS